MQKDERDLLEVLKFELKFLEDGGYGRSPRTPWRPQLIFEDSPTCMNFNCEEHEACINCVLIQLVPPEFRSALFPCRHIPFEASGETLDSFYQSGNRVEIEEVVGNWLRTTIQRLENDRAVAPCALRKEPPPIGGTIKGTPLHQKQGGTPGTFDRSVALHPKCANPACPTAFHWTGGGKFFRFRYDAASQCSKNAVADSPGGVQGVRHYWLCERCGLVFTLAWDDTSGVVLKALWSELPAAEIHKKSSAA